MANLILHNGKLENAGMKQCSMLGLTLGFIANIRVRQGINTNLFVRSVSN